MRKLLTLALALGLLTSGMNAASIITINGTQPTSTAEAHGVAPWDLKWKSDKWAACALPYQTDAQVKRLIRCAIDHWSAGLSIAMYVADRESGYEHLARNTTCCSGVYQQHRRYWSGRVAAYNAAVPGYLEVSNDIYNGRSNILVSIHMAYHGGWSAWSTY